MKILVIGQAPPAVKQGVPYDTTMLYDWLAELGITKEKAQSLFEWEAVIDEFPGFNFLGGHKIPTKKQMDEYWDRKLREKAKQADKIWILGTVAYDYLKEKVPISGIFKPLTLFTMHPSKRNWSSYQRTKDSLLKRLSTFLNIEL